MKHEMGLQSRYFDFIKNGTKRIELRLFDEKRQKIKPGDIIEFSNPDGEKLEAEVVELLRYKTFDELVAGYDVSELADALMSKEEVLEVLAEFYPEEKQKRYGVVGIRVKVL